MKTSRARIASIIGTVTLVAGSCSLAIAQSAGDTKIRFAYQTSIAGGSLMVTEARGLWGVPVESKGFVAGSDVLQAILAGSADAGSMATTPTITGGRTGDFVIVAVANRVGDTTAIVVPPNSSIKTVADLKGKNSRGPGRHDHRARHPQLRVAAFRPDHVGRAPGEHEHG